LRSWLKRPAFREALAESRAQVVEAINQRLLGMAEVALEAIEDSARQQADPALRFRAGVEILNRIQGMKLPKVSILEDAEDEGVIDERKLTVGG